MDEVVHENEARMGLSEPRTKKVEVKVNDDNGGGTRSSLDEGGESMEVGDAVQLQSNPSTFPLANLDSSCVFTFVILAPAHRRTLHYHHYS